jgi:hypothetical protein
MSLSLLYVLDNFSQILVLFMVFNATFSIFCYIVAVSFIGGVNRSTRRKPPTAASHWQSLFHNDASSTLRLFGIRTHNVSRDRHWLHSSCKSNYHTITTLTVPYCIMSIRSMDIRPNYSASVWHIYYLSFNDFF